MKQRFFALYDEYYPRLYAYVLSRTQHRETAEDIVQQVFAKALDRIDTFRPRRDATFGSWLFTIAKHELIDRARSSGRIVFCESGVLDHAASQPCTLTELIEAEVAQEERDRWKQILAALDTLSESERELITLKYLADMSYADIGALMHKKPNTLAVMLKRALEKIRHQMSYENNKGNN